MGRVYVANAFSPSMLTRSTLVDFQKLTPEEWRDNIRLYIKVGRPVKCAIGHPGTARLVEEMLGEKLDCQREAIKVSGGDTVFIIVLNFRLPEGKVYSYDEIKQLARQGQIAFWEARILPPEY